MLKIILEEGLAYFFTFHYSFIVSHSNMDERVDLSSSLCIDC